MKLVYFGSGAFGLPTLRALARDHQVLAVVSQPDRPAGRGGALTPTPIAEWAAGQLPGAPLLKPERVNEAGVVAQLRGLNADAWVVIAFGQKLGRGLLEGVFAVNLHASILPRWRGAAPINAAILGGDMVTGNSVITLADRMDAGAILGQSERPIDPRLTAGELHDVLAEDGPGPVQEVLRNHAAGTLVYLAQDNSVATLAPKLSKADGWVDWSHSAEECRRRIHGLTPWPGVTVQFRGQPLRLGHVEPAKVPGERPIEAATGIILDPAAGTVACGGGTALRVLEVHPAGKRLMPWSDFARGQRVAAGEILVGREPSSNPSAGDRA